MVIQSKKKRREIAPLVLYGVKLPIVSGFKYLGHHLTEDAEMNTDMKVRRNIHIKKICELRSSTPWCHPGDFLHLTKIYSNDFYGYGHWRFSSDEARKIFNTWDVTVKDAYEIPRSTHKYIAENLTEYPTIKTDLITRYRKFVINLCTSPSKEIRTLVNFLRSDVRSIVGDNIRYLCSQCNVNPTEISRKKLVLKLNEAKG